MDNIILIQSDMLHGVYYDLLKYTLWHHNNEEGMFWTSLEAYKIRQFSRSEQNKRWT